MKPIVQIFLLCLFFVVTSCASKDARREPASAVEKTEGSYPEPAENVDLEATEEIEGEATVTWPDSLASGHMPPVIEHENGDKEIPADIGEKSGNDILTGNEPDAEPRFGKLAVYCPHQMIYKQTSDVLGTIADLIDDELIKKMISGKVAEILEEKDITVNDEDFLIKKLQYFNRIELRLNDADNEGFTIKKIHEDDIQLVNDNMEGWHWKVTPTNNSAKQQLVLKVIVYDFDGSKLTSFGKTYNIDVKIQPGIFWRNFYTLFVENPKWAFASIITPVVTFLVGRFSRRKKKKKGKKKKKSD